MPPANELHALRGGDLAEAASCASRLAHGALLCALDRGPRPSMTAQEANVLLAWVSEPDADRGRLKEIQAWLDRTFLVTEPPDIHSTTAPLLDLSCRRSFARQIWAHTFGRLRHGSRHKAINHARMRLLELTAFQAHRHRHCQAMTMRDYLAERMVFHPGPPPLIRLASQTQWILILLMSDVEPKRLVRRFQTLLEQDALSGLEESGWATFWDVAILDLALGHADLSGSAALVRALQPRLAEDLIRGATAPPYVRPDWDENVDESVCRVFAGACL